MFTESTQMQTLRRNVLRAFAKSHEKRRADILDNIRLFSTRLHELARQDMVKFCKGGAGGFLQSMRCSWSVWQRFWYVCWIAEVVAWLPNDYPESDRQFLLNNLDFQNLNHLSVQRVARMAHRIRRDNGLSGLSWSLHYYPSIAFSKSVRMDRDNCQYPVTEHYLNVLRCGQKSSLAALKDQGGKKDSGPVDRSSRLLASKMLRFWRACADSVAAMGGATSKWVNNKFDFAKTFGSRWTKLTPIKTTVSLKTHSPRRANLIPIKIAVSLKNPGSRWANLILVKAAAICRRVSAWLLVISGKVLDQYMSAANYSGWLLGYLMAAGSWRLQAVCMLSIDLCIFELPSRRLWKWCRRCWQGPRRLESLFFILTTLSLSVFSALLGLAVLQGISCWMTAQTFAQLSLHPAFFTAAITVLGGGFWVGMCSAVSLISSCKNSLRPLGGCYWRRIWISENRLISNLWQPSLSMQRKFSTDELLPHVLMEREFSIYYRLCKRSQLAFAVVCLLRKLLRCCDNVAPWSTYNLFERNFLQLNYAVLANKTSDCDMSVVPDVLQKSCDASSELFGVNDVCSQHYDKTLDCVKALLKAEDGAEVQQDVLDSALPLYG